MSRPVRTLIVASTEHLRDAYRDLLACTIGFEVIGFASPGEARALAHRHQPDLLIFALEPGQVHELSLLREIEAASPRTHVFFSTVPRRSLETLRSHRAAGHAAAEFASELVEALRPAEPLPDPSPVADPDHGDGHASGHEGLSSLTPREREVIRMAAEGMSSTETGRELGISARTAECHRAHGMRKLGLHRRADLVRFAMTAGLVGGRTDLR